MDDKTAMLLQGLANKLGTTSEYLWGVLLKQAPVYAAINVAEMIATALIAYAYYRSWAWAKGLVKDYDTEAFGFIYLSLVGVFVLVLALASFFSVGNIVTALMNPEYWAFKQVLAAVKAK